MDFPLVEIEEGVFVLELKNIDVVSAENRQGELVHAISAACLELEELVNMFVPLEDCDFVLAALMAKDLGANIRNIVVATSETTKVSPKNLQPLLEYLYKGNEQLIKDKFESFDKTGAVALNCIRDDLLAGGSTPEETKGAIKAFCEFDDYVFDPVTATAASLYDEYVEETEDETAAIIVSTSSPMQYAKEVLLALGVKSKDEKEAREKLEELFAVEPLEE